MLALTRKAGESLLIFPDDNIPENMTVKELFRDGPLEIKVVNVNYFPRSRQHHVKVGVECPKALRILRDELLNDDQHSSFHKPLTGSDAE